MFYVCLLMREVAWGDQSLHVMDKWLDIQEILAYSKGPSINVNISRVYKPYPFGGPPPPTKKSTHQHFTSAKNPHENNTNQPKKLKVQKKY